MTKRIFIIFIAAIVFINGFAVGIIPIFAHDTMLNITYDDCSESGLVRNNTYAPQDGIDETWYVLNTSSFCYHLGDEVTTIKYHFEEIPENSNIWNTGITQADIEDIKVAYSNSMKKWNNVYFYSYNSDGTVIKNKIINVVEGSASDQDNYISISFVTGTNSYASTEYEDESEDDLEKNNGIQHQHSSKWIMNVNVDYFRLNGNYSSNYVNKVRARTGAHELGHVLGLRDVDNFCDGGDHHEEILMGYGSPLSARSSDIKYKDIAGVAITRGFHADADHKWLYDGVQNDGTYKLICSICNGVKYVNTLSGLTYNTYGACNGNHERLSGNMMAVASYGDEDYFKCKYCRYVAPFFSNLPQLYTVEPVAGGTHHKYTNEVTGLNYSFLEEHTWVGGECEVCGYEHPHTFMNGVCTGCGYVHPHTYTYKYKTGRQHIRTCACGETSTEPHFINSSQIIDGRYATCLGCKRMLDLNVDNATVLPTSITKFSINGSYILPNGIVVLVEEDIEAYMDGTLVFYDRDDLPTVE